MKRPPPHPCKPTHTFMSLLAMASESICMSQDGGGWRLGVVAQLAGCQ